MRSPKVFDKRRWDKLAKADGRRELGPGSADQARQLANAELIVAVSAIATSVANAIGAIDRERVVVDVELARLPQDANGLPPPVQRQVTKSRSMLEERGEKLRVDRLTTVLTFGHQARELHALAEHRLGIYSEVRMKNSRVPCEAIDSSLTLTIPEFPDPLANT